MFIYYRHTYKYLNKINIFHDYGSQKSNSNLHKLEYRVQKKMYSYLFKYIVSHNNFTVTYLKDRGT